MNQTELVEQIEQLEREIREKKKALAELRQQMEGEPVQNYTFISAQGETVSLLELFGEADELIIIHNMGKGCNYCTMWADGFNGVYHHLVDKVPFVLSSPDDPEILDGFAAERGWSFPLISTKGTTFKQDLGFQNRQLHSRCIRFEKR